MKQSTLVLLTFLSLGCASVKLSAQRTGMEWLTTKQGLSQGFVGCLLQDREGFIWAGTKNGLNRYDGYRFEVFTKDPYDEFSLSNDYITHLDEYSDFIIVATAWGGINILHKKTRKVYRLHCEIPVWNTSLDQCFVGWLAVDASGDIWAEVQTPNQPWEFWRMYKFSIPPDFWKKPPPNNDWQKKIAVQALAKDFSTIPYMHFDGKFILVPGPEGVFEINTASLQLSLIAPPLSAEKLNQGSMIQSDEHGRFWIVRGYSINYQRTADIYHYDPNTLGEPSKALQPIALNQKNFALQHIAQGIAWVNFQGEIKGYRIDQNGKFDLNQAEITDIQIPEGACSSLTDRSGNVWFGTNGLGIVKVNPQSKRFRNLFPGESVYSPILQSRNGEVIAYTNNYKLLHYPAQTPKSIIPPFQELADVSMAQDKGGTYWICGRNGLSYDWFLKKIDPAGGLQVFPIPSYNERTPAPMTLDATGDPWIVTAGSLVHFNQKTAQFSWFDFRKIIPGPYEVFSLAQTADGSWWLATRQGLVRAKPSASSAGNFDFESLKNDRTSRNSLRNNLVASLLTDPQDPFVLWIGTKGGGLDRLDVRNLQFTHLTTREGLPDNVIYGILAESGPFTAGTILWMSSNKGLIRYHPSSGAIKNYTEEDGVQANEFNTYAYGKGPTGDLLFGGVNGMTIFHPQQLKEDTLAPHTIITRLRLNDRDVSWNDSTGILSQGIEFTEAIEIPFSRNNLTLEFVALHFASTSKNRFRYYLEGAESEWEHESGEHTASYLNLAPGTYTFRVKGSNSEGVWSKQPAALKITVLPPWYRTWLAWISYVLILGGGIYAFYRYQLRTKLEHAENQRLKELDTFKSRFFTNITHEFRTPLTVILGMTEQLKEGNINSKAGTTASAIALIRRNGQNLLRLINEILDLAKLESHTLQMDYVQGDVLAYLKYISESLHSLANTKNVMLRVESNQAKIVMDYDPERLLQIVHNLLSNAIKFTPGGGRVLLRVELSESSKLSESWLRIMVSDTGVGIPPDDVPHVFERFYQAKNQEHNKSGGTGVGLSLTRELVKAMGGEITAESTLGKGSTFTVRLPITNKARVEEVGMRNVEFSMPNVDGVKMAEGLNPDKQITDTDFPLLLIIEDNPDVVEYLSVCLKQQYRLDFAYNGRSGIEKAMEIVPDVIISDVMMPEKDGFEVCDALKNDERTSHIPVVLLTARATVEDRIAGLRRGADAYLAKPFNPDELLATLENLTKIRQKLQIKYSNWLQPSAATQPSTLNPPPDLEDAFLQKVRAVVEDHLSDSDFEMLHLQRKMAMSHSQIFRKLKALTGKSPSQFIRSIRLNKAKILLSTSDLTVSEIAYETGFSSLQYFSDAFFEAFGQRPSAMRN